MSFTHKVPDMKPMVPDNGPAAFMKRNFLTMQLIWQFPFQTGDIESTKHCLGRAITVQPDQGFTKFLTMA